MADSPGLIVSDASIVPQLIQNEGAGKAYQSVAQSMAIAIQDATDGLRNINTIANTALGVALAQGIAMNDPSIYTSMISAISTLEANAASNFLTIGTNAGTILSQFPSSNT